MNIRALSMSCFTPAFLGECFADNEQGDTGENGTVDAAEPIEAGTEPGDPGHPPEDDDTPVDIDKVRRGDAPSVARARAAQATAPAKPAAEAGAAPPAEEGGESAAPAVDPMSAEALGLQGFDPAIPPAPKPTEADAPAWLKPFMDTQAQIAQEIAADRKERAQWVRQITQREEMQRARQAEAAQVPQPPPEDAPLADHIKYAKDMARYEATKEFAPIRASLERFLKLDEQAHQARQQDLERARQEADEQRNEAVLSDAINRIASVDGYGFLKDEFGDVLFRAAYQMWTKETGRRPDPTALARTMHQYVQRVASPAVKQNQDARKVARQSLADQRQQHRMPKPGTPLAARRTAQPASRGQQSAGGYPAWAKTATEKRGWDKLQAGKLSH